MPTERGIVSSPQIPVMVNELLVIAETQRSRHTANTSACFESFAATVRPTAPAPSTRIRILIYYLTLQYDKRSDWISDYVY